jgi:hypothetical protein
LYVATNIGIETEKWLWKLKPELSKRKKETNPQMFWAISADVPFSWHWQWEFDGFSLSALSPCPTATQFNTDLLKALLTQASRPWWSLCAKANFQENNGGLREKPLACVEDLVFLES